MDHAVLSSYGIDVKAGVARCMNDVAFYEKYLRMFLQDDTFDKARKAYESGDASMLFEYAHELKGVCGNGAMTELYNAICPLVELLRAGNAPWPDVKTAFSRAQTAYARVCSGIELADRQH